MEKEELEYLHERIDHVISFTWKYMLEDYCTRGNENRGTATMDRINLSCIYLRNGYKELTAEDVSKYYEENKERLYNKAIQLLCNESYFYEKYMGQLVFTDKIPYPLPEEFDFPKVNKSALLSYFQNKKNDVKPFGTIMCVIALDNLPEELIVKIIGFSATAAQIILRRQLM